MEAGTKIDADKSLIFQVAIFRETPPIPPRFGRTVAAALFEQSSSRLSALRLKPS